VLLLFRLETAQHKDQHQDRDADEVIVAVAGAESGAFYHPVIAARNRVVWIAATTGAFAPSRRMTGQWVMLNLAHGQKVGGASSSPSGARCSRHDFIAAVPEKNQRFPLTTINRSFAPRNPS
jgi:hypothetical protein